MKGVAVDLVGQRFGRLVVQGRVSRPNRAGAFWLCRCDCGGAPPASIGTSQLLRGSTQSCGCLRIERIKAANSTHKMTQTPTYVSWKSMWARCTDPGHKSYDRYKDLAPPQRWLSFENFLADMGERPAGTSLDRVDNKLPYSPGNCRWATPREQQGNTKRSILVDVGGSQVCLKEACRRTGSSYPAAKRRAAKGLNPMEAA